MSCDIGKTAEGLAPPHSPTLTLFHLRHCSFSNPSAALPTSQLIVQPFRCFTYVIGTSPTSPGEPPKPLWWCLIYPLWFYNLQWLRAAGLYEGCKLALELKRLKTPALSYIQHTSHYVRTCLPFPLIFIFCLEERRKEERLILHATVLIIVTPVASYAAAAAAAAVVVVVVVNLAIVVI